MSHPIEASALSDTGTVRQTNEDAWGSVPELNFYVLADGLGGHQAGEIAAREAVAAACRLISLMPRIDDLESAQNSLKRLVTQINGIIYHLGSTQNSLQGMGTTICCLQFLKDGAAYAHVGDSRIYRFHDHHLIQLTKDHSLLRELKEGGQLPPDESEDQVYKSILTKAIGTEATIEAAVSSCETEPNDLFLICSDGLSDALSHEEIEEILCSTTNLEQAVKTLVLQAKNQRGSDNITAVLMKVVDTNEQNLPRQ